MALAFDRFGVERFPQPSGGIIRKGLVLRSLEHVALVGVQMLVMLGVGVLWNHTELQFRYALFGENGVGHIEVLQSTHGEVRSDGILALFGVVGIGGAVLDPDCERPLITSLGDQLNLFLLQFLIQELSLLDGVLLDSLIWRDPLGGT